MNRETEKESDGGIQEHFDAGSGTQGGSSTRQGGVCPVDRPAYVSGD